MTAPAATAGVIQRVVINGHDTETRLGLRNLKRQVLDMRTVEEVDGMLAKIPADTTEDGAKQLLAALQEERAFITRPKKTPSKPASAQPSIGLPASRSRIQPPPPPREQHRGAEEVVPVSGAVTSAKTAAVINPEQPVSEKPSAEPVATVRPTVRQDAPPARREKPPPEQREPAREIAKESVAAPESESLDAALAGLTKEGEALAERGTKLKAGHPPGAVETWLENVIGFLNDQKSWQERLSALGRATPRPLRPVRETLQDFAWDLERQKNAVEFDRKWADDQRHKKEQEAAHRDKMIAEREQEVTGGKRTLGLYVEPPEIKLEGPALDTEKWGKHAARLPKLFLEWLFTAALKHAKEHPSKWTSALLEFLKGLKQSQASGPFVDVIGNTKLGDKEAGLSVANWIIVKIDLPTTKLMEVLTREDAEHTKIRNDLITETASTFIHEAAHVRQMRVYGNASFPWKPHEDFGGFSLGKPEDKGVPYAKWTPDVQAAFDEFQRGGSSGQAKDDTKWKSVFDALHEKRYYDPVTKLDDRASELVSHLIELAYAWGDDKFRAIFPLGAGLLDRTILSGT